MQVSALEVASLLSKFVQGLMLWSGGLHPGASVAPSRVCEPTCVHQRVCFQWLPLPWSEGGPGSKRSVPSKYLHSLWPQQPLSYWGAALKQERLE